MPGSLIPILLKSHKKTAPRGRISRLERPWRFRGFYSDFLSLTMVEDLFCEGLVGARPTDLDELAKRSYIANDRSVRSGPARIRVTKRARLDRPGTPCPADGRAAIITGLPELSRPEAPTNPSPSAATGRPA